jgi:hypothetical protein
MNRTTTACVVCATAVWIGLLVASFAPAPERGDGPRWHPSSDSKLLARAPRPVVGAGRMARSEP